MDIQDKYFVLETGTDCDGFGRDAIYAYDTKEEAEKSAEESNYWSDGQRYHVITYDEIQEHIDNGAEVKY